MFCELLDAHHAIKGTRKKGERTFNVNYIMCFNWKDDPLNQCQDTPFVKKIERNEHNVL